MYKMANLNCILMFVFFCRNVTYWIFQRGPCPWISYILLWSHPSNTRSRSGLCSFHKWIPTIGESPLSGLSPRNGPRTRVHSVPSPLTQSNSIVCTEIVPIPMMIIVFIIFPVFCSCHSHGPPEHPHLCRHHCICGRGNRRALLHRHNLSKVNDYYYYYYSFSRWRCNDA